MIDKRVSYSKKLGMISDKAARLWFMIYPHLDREGRIAFDDLEDLKDETIPKLKRWPLKKVANSLNELADVGLIHIYPNKNKIALQFERFEDFQLGLRKDREGPSKIDAPEEAPDNSGVFRISPALSLSISKGKEGKKEDKIQFNFETEQWENVLPSDIERWKKTYPKCDINQELLFMADWLLSNPEKRKSNYKKFISNWLRRSQDRGGTKKTFTTDKPNPIKERLQREREKLNA